MTFAFAVATVTPLIYVLGVVFGVAVGLFLLSLVKGAEDEDHDQERTERVAKLAARRAVDETLRGIGEGRGDGGVRA